MGDDVQLHAISRSQYRRRDQCNFPSQARTNVCQRRADVLEMLNDGDNQIYMYSDAQGMFYIGNTRGIEIRNYRLILTSTFLKEYKIGGGKMLRTRNSPHLRFF